MPSATSGGGSNIASAQIVDGTIVAVDINDATITAAKMAAGSGIPTVEKTAGTTHSLTTTATNTVLVIAKGNVSGNGWNGNVNLKYGGVTKDFVTMQATGDGGTNKDAFCLVYSETPGAATADITVDGLTVNNVVITVLKLK
jgi:hypothetical protein